MADDIARLGLAIDSAPAAKASQELDKLVNSSKRAEAANDDLASAAEAAGRGIDQITRETKGARAALEQATTAARSVEAAAVALGRNAIAPTVAYVRAIEQVNNALRVQQQINRNVGVRSAGDAAGRAADIAAYGEALDDLRAKFNPLFAAERQHRQAIEEIAEAARIGAISEKERADAITRTTGVYEAQVAQIRRLEGALRNQAAAAKAAAESMVARQTITPNRSEDIAAYGRELDALRERFNPLFAAAQRYEAEIGDIARALKVGAISQEEHTAALERAGAAYQAQTTQIKRLEAALASQAAAAKVAAQAAVSRQTITPDRGADIAAYGAELERLRAKYNPLYAAGQEYRQTLQEINEAAKVGAINEEERSAALKRTEVAYAKQVVGLKQVAEASGLAGHQMMNLSRQMNDVVTMGLMGASPFQIITSQAGQVYQVLQEGQGGVTGSLKDLAGRLAALATPARIAGASLAAVGITAVASYASWMNGQAEVERSLLGVGRASGATVAQINGIADAYAEAGKVSVSAAREMASAFAGTGRISPDLFGDAIASAKDFARILGTDAADAAGKLASALADPAHGAEQLNQILGAFDAGTLKRIQSLDAQNRTTEAQRLIIEGVKNATDGAERTTTKWSRTWDDLGVAISNVWSKFGQTIDAATGNGPLEAQKSALEARLKQIDDARAAEADHLKQLQKWGYSSDQIKAEIPALAALDGMYKEVTGSLQKVNEQLQKAAEKAKEAREALASLKLMGTINIVMPEIDIRQQLENRALVLSALAGDTAKQASSGITQQQATLAAQRANEAAKSYLTTQESATKQLELQNRAITARSPAERASIAAEQKRLELAGSNLSEQEKSAQVAQVKANALKEGAFALSEQERQRVLAAQESIAQQQLETQLIGKTAEEQALLRANFASYWDLKREAAQNGLSDIDRAQYERLKKLNEEMAKGVELAARLKLQNDLIFERSQLGRTEGDQQIASSLRSLGLPVDLDSYEAGLMRVNAQLKDMRETASTALSGFASDMLRGASAAEALSNQLASIADKLIKMAMDQLVAQAFGGLLGNGSGSGLLSGLFGGGGTVGNTAGAMYVAGNHSGGIIGRDQTFTRGVSPWAFFDAPKFHTGGGFFANNERPAILQVGEEVLTRDDPRHILNFGRIRRPDVGTFDGGAAGAITTSFSPTFNIDATGSNMTQGEIQAMALSAVQAWWKGQRGDVVRIIRDARSRRVPGV
ncbi:phage tail length tape measure family protein [Xanthobacter oligotrophicus]|uniref:Phage tail length tape measure family protein n=1 Tax=Xanthobacter oligotrophicus TaxID=2607286 RepID=A0ABW6ZRZ5_9HYPH